MFNLLLVQPLLNLLILIYSALPGHDFGIAIILITVLVRLVIWPFQSQTLRNQKAFNAIQPEVKKIQAKYKNDPQKMNAMMMELYKEKEVNPFSSCLPSLIQLPIMIALFYALIKFKDPNYINMTNQAQGLMHDLYLSVKTLPFVQNALAQPFSTTLLGIVDLAKPNYVLAVIAGAVQFIQTKMLTLKKEEGGQAAAMNSMLYLFPVLTIMIGITFPAALPLYWIVTTLMAILQQWLVMREQVEEMEEKK
jgi:YidC/Oxa1 family membrane protein insertase